MVSSWALIALFLTLHHLHHCGCMHCLRSVELHTHCLPWTVPIDWITHSLPPLNCTHWLDYTLTASPQLYPLIGLHTHCLPSTVPIVAAFLACVMIPPLLLQHQCGCTPCVCRDSPPFSATPLRLYSLPVSWFPFFSATSLRLYSLPVSWSPPFFLQHHCSCTPCLCRNPPPLFSATACANVWPKLAGVTFRWWWNANHGWYCGVLPIEAGFVVNC